MCIRDRSRRSCPGGARGCCTKLAIPQIVYIVCILSWKTQLLQILLYGRCHHFGDKPNSAHWPSHTGHTNTHHTLISWIRGLLYIDTHNVIWLEILSQMFLSEITHSNHILLWINVGLYNSLKQREAVSNSESTLDKTHQTFILCRGYTNT